MSVARMEENTSSTFLSLSLGTKRIKERKKSEAVANKLSVVCRIHSFFLQLDRSGGASMLRFRLDDALKVHPTELHFPYELHKDNYSCSFQLTNITDRIVAYFFWCQWRRLLVSQDVAGTILPRSTCSVTLTVTLNGLPEPLDGTQWIDIWAYVVEDGVKAEDITKENFFRTSERARGYFQLPVVPAAISCSAVPEKNEKGSLLDDNNGMSNFNFQDLLIVHPTELNIPLELNKDNYSYSIQLTNITDQLIAYYFSCWWRGPFESPDANTYMGAILPHSTCCVTVTVKLTTEPTEDMQYSRSWITIRAYVAKDGVKAVEITRENLGYKAKCAHDFFTLSVFYDYTVPAANSCSAVPEKNEKGSLLDHNNLLNHSINDEVHGTTSGGKKKSSVRRQSSNEMSSIVLFSDQEIKCATNGLSDSSKIGQGGYGAVYKGSLHDTEVAIKMLDSNSQQGIDEFLQEMEVLGRMRHPNLVKLIGACVKLRALVYEFLPHGSLGDCLQKNPGILTWQMRTRIVYEICLALTFLHSIKPQPVVHGDLKPANILLGANFISKLADFGLCRFIPEGTTSVAFLDTKPKGTFGYIDPEFMRTGILTPDCDVYSFGVTILRLLTRMDALGIGTKVRIAYKEKSLMTMVDTTAGQWPTDVSELLAYFGLKCCAKRKSPGLMKEIAEDLEEILAEIGR